MATVQHLLVDPSGAPIAGKTVTITLVAGSTGGFIGSNEEVLSRTYATTDATGLWTATLAANSTITPSGSYFTVTQLRETLGFVVPAGAGPFWLHDILAVTPASPTGLVIGDALGAAAAAQAAAAVDADADVAEEATRANATFVPQVLVQTGEAVPLPIYTMTPKTAGAPPFQVQANSFPNAGAGAGTENHTVHYGWNAFRHSSGPGGVNGKAAMLMGFEDNYYDNGGTNQYGTEFYVEYWSPDGTSQQMRRPFYCRSLGSDSNGAFNCPIRMDVGAADFAIGNGGTSFLAASPTTLTVSSASAFFTCAAFNHVPAGNAQALFTIESPNPVLRFRTAGALLWEMISTSTTHVLYDQNVRAHMSLTYGATAAAAISSFDSTLVTTQSLATPAVIGNGGANGDLYLRTGGGGAGTMTFYDASLTSAMQITTTGNIIVKAGMWLASAGTTGFMLGNNTTAKMGFWGKTPVAQQARPVTLTDVITLLNTTGLCA